MALVGCHCTGPHQLGEQCWVSLVPCPSLSCRWQGGKSGGNSDASRGWGVVVVVVVSVGGAGSPIRTASPYCRELEGLSKRLTQEFLKAPFHLKQVPCLRVGECSSRVRKQFPRRSPYLRPGLFFCSNTSPTHPVEALPLGGDVSVCGRDFWLRAPRQPPSTHLKAPSLCLQHLLPSASIQDAQQWLHRKEPAEL